MPTRQTPPTKRLERLEARFQRIARRLPDAALGADDVDILSSLGRAGDERLLGFYTTDGVLHALEAYGVLASLRRRGYARFEVRFALDEFAHTMRLFGDDLLLCDCRLRRARGVEDPCFAEWQRRFVPDLLVVEWLALEDPRGDFSPERPRLPGQRHPGSGVGAEVFMMLIICAQRLGLHGLSETPERFHNALMYSHRAHFFDPIMQGRFLALADLVKTHALADVAWAMERGAVIDTRSGAPIEWQAREQVSPMDRRLLDYFDLPAWRETVEAERAALGPNLAIEPGAPAQG